MDSGAFTEISTHGRYREGVDEYVDQIERWSRCGDFHGAVSQDWMCEPFILEKTGLSVEDHQQLTIDRYMKIRAKTDVPIIPVLQGYEPGEYAHHTILYGKLLKHGAWVGVGSICRRNTYPQQIEAILVAVKTERPDLRLHGFGVKLTSLASELVTKLLFSADSMAWSFADFMSGRKNWHWENAKRFERRINTRSIQGILNLPSEFWS